MDDQSVGLAVILVEAPYRPLQLAHQGLGVVGPAGVEVAELALFVEAEGAAQVGMAHAGLLRRADAHDQVVSRREASHAPRHASHLAYEGRGDVGEEEPEVLVVDVVAVDHLRGDLILHQQLLHAVVKDVARRVGVVARDVGKHDRHVALALALREAVGAQVSFEGLQGILALFIEEAEFFLP